MHMLILSIITGLLLAWRAASWLVAYHKQKLTDEQERTRGYHRAAAILASEIETAHFARDYYRGALNEIVSITTPDDPAGGIARRFLQHEEHAA